MIIRNDKHVNRKLMIALMFFFMLSVTSFAKTDVYAGEKIAIQNTTTKSKVITGRLMSGGKNTPDYQIKAKIGKKTYISDMNNQGVFSIPLKKTLRAKTRIWINVYRKKNNAWQRCGYKQLSVNKYKKKYTKKQLKKIASNFTVNLYKISKDEVLMVKGKKKTVKINTSKVSWKSSNTKVAKVSSKGVITAKGAGSCKITGKTRDGVSLTCKVYVPVLSVTTISLKNGGPGVALSMLNNPGRTVTYSSSNDKVAVYRDGLVVPAGAGKCTITAKIDNKSYCCKVFVPSFSRSEITMSESYEGIPLILKNSAESVNYSTSDDKIAVYENGKVIPKGIGTCNILASTSGMTFSCPVVVTESKNEAFIFLKHLKEYSDFIKAHGTYFDYYFDKNIDTFQKAKEQVAAGNVVGITCVVPARWALKEMNISTSGFQAKSGKFDHCYKNDVEIHFNWITKGSVIGKTVKKAVDAKLLEPGDVITYKNQTHISVYTGEKYNMYEGATKCQKNGEYPNGVCVSYKSYSGTISQILRWKYTSNN